MSTPKNLILWLCYIEKISWMGNSWRKKFNSLPFRKKIRIVQNCCDDTSSMIRGIAVHSTNNESQLWLDLNKFFGIVHNNDEVASSFVIKAKIFGEALSAQKFHASFSKKANRIGVAIQIATRKALWQKMSWLIFLHMTKQCLSRF